MPPSPASGKRKAEDGESIPSPKKAAPGPTTSAKAAASGAESIVRSETPRKPLLADGKGLCLVHWNVAGLNAVLKSDEKRARLKALVEAERPDVLALSEHKIAENKLAAAAKDLTALLPDHKAHWAICTVKNGYSGVVCLVRDGAPVPTSVALDSVGSLNEGRTVTLEVCRPAPLILPHAPAHTHTHTHTHTHAPQAHSTQGQQARPRRTALSARLARRHCTQYPDVAAVAAYVPNSGQKLERLDHRIKTWEPAMRAHMKALEAKGKAVVLFGDLNVAHLDVDIWNHSAKHIPKSAGTTPQERAAFAELLADGYVDCFRGAVLRSWTP